jgi:8-oxo-dGTP pyrophosphatase MutT (NUDIX family)
MTILDPSKNPWKTVGSREVYINPWLRIREDHVIRPDDKPGIYGVVEFRNLALGVVPIDDDLHTYLVGQWRYPLNAYSWEIPEGGGALAVSALKSIQRELKEETGLIAGEWVDLGEFALSNSVTNEVGRVFLARNLVLGEAEPEGDEVLSLRRIPFLEACEMAYDGRITDAVSIIGLLRARRFLGL